jgi:DNA-directed RNA polymerase III subunit RPC2
MYMAVMVRRMLFAVYDKSFVDDRDYYGNKRLELAGTWTEGVSLSFLNCR